MKQIKQMAAILLLLAMLFVGAGCGKREEPPVGNDIDVQQEQQMEAQPAHDPADDIQPIVTGTVTLSVSCAALLDHLDIYMGDVDTLPADGMIIPATEVELYENDTAYTLLKRVCTENDIALEVKLYDVVCVDRIDGISPDSRGLWLFVINGEIPPLDVQSYPLQDGDVVKWCFTFNLDEDIADEQEK